jgi:PAS domain-containing protein
MTLAPKNEDNAREAAFSRTLIAALPYGVITYSADGTCRSANEAAARLLDVPPMICLSKISIFSKMVPEDAKVAE